MKNLDCHKSIDNENSRANTKNVMTKVRSSFNKLQTTIIRLKNYAILTIMKIKDYPKPF